MSESKKSDFSGKAMAWSLTALVVAACSYGVFACVHAIAEMYRS